MAKVIAYVDMDNGQFVPVVRGHVCPRHFASRHAANKALNSAMRSGSWKQWTPSEARGAEPPAAAPAPVARPEDAVMSAEEAASYADIDWGSDD